MAGFEAMGKIVHLTLILKSYVLGEVNKRRSKQCSEAKLTSTSSSGSTTISTMALEEIIENLSRKQHRDSTSHNYYSIWKLFNKFFINLDIKPREWSDRIILFAAYLIDNHRKSQTVKSYISAIKAVLQANRITVNEDVYLLQSLTRACWLTQDTVYIKLPIRHEILQALIEATSDYYNQQGQNYLAVLFPVMFSTAYYGLLRVGELTHGDHVIKAKDVHLADNKQKFLLLLRTSKTHTKADYPQSITITGINWKVKNPIFCSNALL